MLPMALNGKIRFQSPFLPRSLSTSISHPCGAVLTERLPCARKCSQSCQNEFRFRRRRVPISEAVTATSGILSGVWTATNVKTHVAEGYSMVMLVKS
jgi:hypothetical protein